MALMRLGPKQLAGLAATIFFTSACSIPPPAERNSIVDLTSSCQQVEIPEEWQIQNMDPQQVGWDGKPYEGMVPGGEGDEFELRRLGNRIAIALISGRTLYRPPNVFSEQKYSFALDHSVSLVRITEQQWSLATPLFVENRGPQIELSADLDPHPKENSFSYKGVQFKGSGKYLLSSNKALQSLNHLWIAVQSVDGEEKGITYAPYQGLYYIDVFNATSGAKQFTVKMFITNGIHGRSRWIDDDHLFVDLFSTRQGFILCDASKSSK